MSKVKILGASMIRELTERRDAEGKPVPFSIRARSRKGEDLSSDNVICLAAYPGAGQRLIEYVASGQKRRVYDCLIFRINDYKIKLT